MHLCAFQIKQANMMLCCSCGGDYAPLLPVAQFRQKATIFRSIATHYHMPQLLEAVNWLARVNKWSL